MTLPQDSRAFHEANMARMAWHLRHLERGYRHWWIVTLELRRELRREEAISR